MNAAQYTAAAPFALLTLAPIVVMLAIAVRRRHRVCLWLTLASLTLTLILLWQASGRAPVTLTPLLVIDSFALFYTALTMLVTIAVVILGVPYLAREESQPEEYYILLLLAAAGGSVMAASTHFASFYLGLEILSVSQYGLVAYVRRDRRGTEAGLKYLIIAAASAAFLLFGMALVYAELGTMQFAALANAAQQHMSDKLVLLGVAMMLTSIGFKLSMAPFHLWTPDVYEGAPTPVTAFIATASKIGVFAVIVRYFTLADAPVSHSLYAFLAVTAAASMLAGNVLALIQQNIKRLLAYSSIAHMGYLALAFLAGGQLANDAVAFYAVAYSAATIGAFGVVIAVAPHIHGQPGMERVENYRGLFWTRPHLAIVLAISLLSLMGIPLTAGFVGKLYVILAGAHTGHWGLLILLAISSVLGAYYYLRIIVLLFLKPASNATGPALPRVTLSGSSMLIATAALSLGLGIYPAPLISMIHALLPN